MTKFVFTTVGTGGDINPFIRVGAELTRRGHTAGLITHRAYQNEVIDKGILFHPLDTDVDYRQFVEDGVLLNDPRGSVEFTRRHILPKVAAEYQLLKDVCEQTHTVLVARSSPGIAARMIVERYKIPLVSVFVAPSLAATHQLLEKSLGTVFGSEINSIRAQLGFPPVDDWVSWLQMPTLNIGLWPEWFEKVVDNIALDIRSTGFMWGGEGDGELPSEVNNILTTRIPVVLVTGGTGKFASSQFFGAICDAAKDFRGFFIIVSRHRELLPMTLHENIHWIKKVPSLESLMNRVNAIIHHGGMGISSQALAAGIPHLVSPPGGDRLDTAQRLQKLGVAEVILPRQWTPNAILSGLSSLLQSAKAQAACTEVATQLRYENPLENICSVLENVAQDEL